MSASLFIGNTNVAEWTALTNSITGEVDTGASVTVTVLDSEGEEVTGETWPKSMTHDTGGTYRASLAAGIGITEDADYTLVIDAVGSDGGVGKREIPVKARIRNA